MQQSFHDFCFFRSCSYWLSSAWSLSNHVVSFTFIALSLTVPNLHSWMLVFWELSHVLPFLSKHFIISSFFSILRVLFICLFYVLLFVFWSGHLDMFGMLNESPQMQKNSKTQSFRIRHSVNNELIEEIFEVCPCIHFVYSFVAQFSWVCVFGCCFVFT